MLRQAHSELYLTSVTTSEVMAIACEALICVGPAYKPITPAHQRIIASLLRTPRINPQVDKTLLPNSIFINPGARINILVWPALKKCAHQAIAIEHP